MANGLSIELSAGVLTLAIALPETRNALTPAVLGDMAQALADAAGNEAVRMVILRGKDDLPFSSGFDLGAVPGRRYSLDEARALHAPIRRVAELILDLPQPVVGAAQGFVYGAGLDLFVHCDIRIGAQGTKFCMPPARHGFLYPHEGIARLCAVVGTSRATEMLMLADPVTTEVAERWDLIHRVVAAETFEADLRAMSDALLARAPLSLAGTKRSLRREAALRADEAFVADAYLQLAECLNSEDAREGLAAFRERRAPRFRGV